jgi:hypothetical protein
MSAANLDETIADGGIASVNFFNGRLLSGEDLSREQAATRDARLRLGRVVGEGVAHGLEVAEAAGTSSKSRPVVRIEPGAAINADGLVLELVDRTDLVLVEDIAPGGPDPVELFVDCVEPTTGTYAAGFGVYLLTIGPGEQRRGLAPTSGLGNVEASCNTNVFVEGVRFRLTRVAIAAGEVATAELLRNHVAARSFGVFAAARSDFLSNPFGPAAAGWGLVDDLRKSCLDRGEVPLAVLAWTASKGIEFVDLWSVRRRTTTPLATPRWPFLVGDRVRAEAEAMFLQFEAHATDLTLTTAARTMAAADSFEYLPPVGIIPIIATGSPQGFNAGAFFGEQASTRAEITDAQILRSLLHEGLLHEPIEVGAKERIQLYLLYENVRAFRQGPTQLALVFAKDTVPYRGIARFGDAYWDLSRFAQTVM